MELLKQKIKDEGEVYEGNILKVDCFLNHQIDIPFLREVGREFHRLFKDDKINKILTIEASGIAIGSMVAQEFECPLVFAKRTRPKISRAMFMKRLLSPLPTEQRITLWCPSVSSARGQSAYRG